VKLSDVASDRQGNHRDREAARHEGLTRVSDWMRSLAGPYVNSRIAHPEDDLLVVFDIDGTILDMGH
jgi:hypothetical protein